MNSNNEDSLLDDIDAEQSLNDMLLNDETEEAGATKPDDDLLV